MSSNLSILPSGSLDAVIPDVPTGDSFAGSAVTVGSVCISGIFAARILSGPPANTPSLFSLFSRVFCSSLDISAPSTPVPFFSFCFCFRSATSSSSLTFSSYRVFASSLAPSLPSVFVSFLPLAVDSRYADVHSVFFCSSSLAVFIFSAALPAIVPATPPTPLSAPNAPSLVNNFFTPPILSLRRSDRVLPIAPNIPNAPSLLALGIFLGLIPSDIFFMASTNFLMF